MSDNRKPGWQVKEHKSPYKGSLGQCAEPFCGAVRGRQGIAGKNHTLHERKP